MTTEPETTQLPMACNCGVEGVQEIDRRRRRIFWLMGLGEMRELTTAILLSLAFDFGADATIAADMWFGVFVTSPLGNVYVECDDPADGFAAAWEQLASMYPKRITVGRNFPNLEHRARLAMETTADRLLVAHEEASQRYEAHRAQAHNGPNDCPPCEPCKILLGAAVETKIALENAWGADVLKPAVDRIFEE